MPFQISLSLSFHNSKIVWVIELVHKFQSVAGDAITWRSSYGSENGGLSDKIKLDKSLQRNRVTDCLKETRE